MKDTNLQWDLAIGNREHGEYLVQWQSESEEVSEDFYNIKTHYVVIGPSGKILLSLVIVW